MDANVSALAKISEKIHRKPALSNALYVHATVEELPSELDGVANEVHVHLPWGSLLREVLKPRYKAAGFEVLEMGMFASGEWPSLHTSWAKRLRNNRDRSTIYIVARALASPSLE